MATWPSSRRVYASVRAFSHGQDPNGRTYR